MQRGVERTLELLIVHRQQTVAPFEQVVPVLLFGRAVIDVPEIAIAALAGEFVLLGPYDENRFVAAEQQAGR